MIHRDNDALVAYGLAAVFLAAISVCLGLVFFGCFEGDDLPGSGPTITTSHPELVTPFVAAVDVVGDSLQRDLLADPALVLDVTLVDGASFNSTDVLDGAPLWGRNRLVVTGKGPRCQVTLALRVPPAEVKPSGTSLAHEAAHCALDWLLAPDGAHEQRSVWEWAVPRANEALEVRGL
jgi:hypothetical protein